jgi:hypothetical protein
MKLTWTYQEEADRLAKAIDLAIESFEKYCPAGFEKHHLDHTISCYQEWKKKCLNPEPRYRNLSSIKYSIQDVFTYFQEAGGDTVEYFWKRINEEGLSYSRENKFKKIIKRGKIKGKVEYDYVKDMIVVAEQVGLTTSEETHKLNQLIADFESRKKI